MKGFDKKGQFFLLAAVIIATVVISLGAIKSSVIVSAGGEDLGELVEEVRHEAGQVIEYEISNSATGGRSLFWFAGNTSEEIQEIQPHSNFVLIYPFFNFLVVDRYEPSGNTELNSSEFFEVQIKDSSGTFTTIPSGAPNVGNRNLVNIDTSLVDVEAIHIFIGTEEVAVFPISISRDFNIIIQREIDDEKFIASA